MALLFGRTRGIFLSLPVVFACGLLAVTTAHAADPSPLVGRVSYIDGTVSFHDATQTQWSYTALNYPVTAGLSFWTEPGARSEIEIGSSQLRMDSSTAIDILQLDPSTRQIQIDQGSINYYVAYLNQGETIEVETPHGAVAITQPGTYHIDAGDANNPTVVVTLEGQARLIAPNSYLDIETGEQAAAIGDPVSYTMTQAQSTPFDDWALQRDNRTQEIQAVKYVSPETTGYQDLDQYGTWQPSPQYGQVWIPQSVPATWVPYREGHWAFVQPWGWTWIDDQPWGFAPFHYGRWAQIDNRWAWVPGRVVAQPVYAPALVAFTAGLPGLDLSVSIGWLPLGPGEVYRPPYNASRNYLRNVNYGTVNNITNITKIRTVNNYANRGGATVVPTAAFTGARPVAAAARTPDAGEFQKAAVNTNLTALKPTAYARVATAAPANQNAAVRTAPGPSTAVHEQEASQIHREEPNSLSTQGKVEEQPHEGAAAQRPAAAQSEAIASAQRAGAPGPEIRTNEAAQHAPTEHAPVERAPAVERIEQKPEPARETAARPHEGSEPGTAPGPAVDRSVARAAVPVRQREVNNALQHPQVQPQRAPQVQAAAAKPAAAPRVQVAYKPAAVPKPVQAQPLHPTPTGWHRDEPKEEEPKK